jgi:hypothetical protein
MTAPATRHQPAPSPPGGQQAQAQAHRQAYTRRKTRAKVKGEALRQREAARVEALPVQHPHAAGIDIGSRSHWVCVGFTTDAASCLIQEFPAHTDGLKAIAAFLREHQVTTIAMESTGISWVPLDELLQAEGFEVLLPANGSGTLAVTYNVVGSASASGRPGSALGGLPPFAMLSILVSDAAGTNVGSDGLAVTAVGLAPASNPSAIQPVHPVGGSNPGNRLVFVSWSYLYVLDTSALAAGNYLFYVTVQGDPVVHAVPFQVL